MILNTRRCRDRRGRLRRNSTGIIAHEISEWECDCRDSELCDTCFIRSFITITSSSSKGTTAVATTSSSSSAERGRGTSSGGVSQLELFACTAQCDQLVSGGVVREIMDEWHHQAVRGFPIPPSIDPEQCMAAFALQDYSRAPLPPPSDIPRVCGADDGACEFIQVQHIFDERDPRAARLIFICRYHQTFHVCGGSSAVHCPNTVWRPCGDGLVYAYCPISGSGVTVQCDGNALFDDGERVAVGEPGGAGFETGGGTRASKTRRRQRATAAYDESSAELLLPPTRRRNRKHARVAAASGSNGGEEIIGMARGGDMGCRPVECGGYDPRLFAGDGGAIAVRVAMGDELRRIPMHARVTSVIEKAYPVVMHICDSDERRAISEDAYKRIGAMVSKTTAVYGGVTRSGERVIVPDAMSTTLLSHWGDVAQHHPSIYPVVVTDERVYEIARRIALSWYTLEDCASRARLEMPYNGYTYENHIKVAPLLMREGFAVPRGSKQWLVEPYEYARIMIPLPRWLQTFRMYAGGGGGGGGYITEYLKRLSDMCGEFEKRRVYPTRALFDS